jgi:hypothetical protein
MEVKFRGQPFSLQINTYKIICVQSLARKPFSAVV